MEGQRTTKLKTSHTLPFGQLEWADLMESTLSLVSKRIEQKRTMSWSLCEHM